MDRQSTNLDDVARVETALSILARPRRYTETVIVTPVEFYKLDIELREHGVSTVYVQAELTPDDEPEIGILLGHTKVIPRGSG
jgi:hypothetical protein